MLSNRKTVFSSLLVAALALPTASYALAAPAAVDAATQAPRGDGVRTVKPGEKIKVGSGTTLWLNRTGYCFLDAGIRTCKDLFDENHGGIPDKGGYLGMQTHGDRGELRVVGSYRGQGTVARITVDYRGKRSNASLVKLARAKGWVVLYTALPAGPGPQQPRLTAYDAAGKVLATLG